MLLPFSLPQIPPFLSPAPIPPHQLLPRCRMWLCQAASLHPERPLQLITPPPCTAQPKSHRPQLPPTKQPNSSSQHPKLPQILPPAHHKPPAQPSIPIAPNTARKPHPRPLCRTVPPPPPWKNTGEGVGRSCFISAPSGPNEDFIFSAGESQSRQLGSFFHSHLHWYNSGFLWRFWCFSALTELFCCLSQVPCRHFVLPRYK